MEYKDYYKALGIEKKATQDEIKHAYRRLARKYHPDVSKEHNAEEKFKNVQEAYEVLKDPEKRTAYDQLGSNWKAGQEFRPPPGGKFHAGRDNAEGFSGFSDSDMGGFSDFFTQFFGRAQAQSGGENFEGFQQRGSDQNAKVNITLEEAHRGVTKMLKLEVPEIDASGRMRTQTRTLKVNLPAGAYEGQQVRLAKQGGPGSGGAPAGDLYLEIHIVSHPLFSIEGRDVYLTLPVTPWEAALGANIKVPTLSGSVGLKLVAGSQSGQKLRLKGRGMPGKPEAGDQYAVLQIKIPKVHTEEQRKMYEKMSEIMPYNPRKDWPV